MREALLQFLQEILASHLAGAPPPRVAKDAPLLVHLLARAQVSGKAFKMAAYGALVSAPLAHALISALQRAFTEAERIIPGVTLELINEIVDSVERVDDS